MLADFNTGSNEPTIRDWVWVPDTLSTWEDTEWRFLTMKIFYVPNKYRELMRMQLEFWDQAVMVVSQSLEQNVMHIS